MDIEKEAKRLATPTQVPPFWRYLWKNNYWAYYNVPMSLLAWVFVVFYFENWWASFLIGLLFGASVTNAIGSWKLWRKRVRLQNENEEWVRKVSTGPHPFPPGLAWSMVNLVNEGKTSAAATLALRYMEMTDPRIRQASEEFDALPEDEKKRRMREAIAEADRDIAREKRKR